MTEFTTFLYSSIAATIASFLLTRTYEEYKNRSSRKQRLFAYCAVLTKAIENDLFLIEELIDPEKIYFSYKDLINKLSTNVGIDQSVELCLLDSQVFFSVAAYYQTIEKFKVYLRNLNEQSEVDDVIFTLLVESVKNNGRITLQTLHGVCCAR